MRPRPSGLSERAPHGVHEERAQKGALGVCPPERHRHPTLRFDIGYHRSPSFGITPGKSRQRNRLNGRRSKVRSAPLRRTKRGGQAASRVKRTRRSEWPTLGVARPPRARHFHRHIICNPGLRARRGRQENNNQMVREPDVAQPNQLRPVARTSLRPLPTLGPETFPGRSRRRGRPACRPRPHRSPAVTNGPTIGTGSSGDVRSGGG